MSQRTAPDCAGLVPAVRGRFLRLLAATWAGPHVRVAALRLRENEPLAAVRLIDRALRVPTLPHHRVALLQVKVQALTAVAEYADAERRCQDLIDAAHEANDAFSAVAGQIEQANLLRILGQQHGGLTLAREALDSATRFGETALQARALNALGILHKDLGDYDAAEESYRQAAALIAPDAEDAATLAHNLAGLAHARGRSQDGLTHARQALALRVDVHGIGAPEVAADRAVLAALLIDLDRLDEAEQEYRRALATYERLYGSDHYEIAVVLGGLAVIAQYRGRPAEAESKQRRSLDIKRRILGPDHHEIGTLLNNLARTLELSGRADEAQETAVQAVRILEQSLGPEHPTSRACR